MSSIDSRKIFARNLRRFLDDRGMQDKDLMAITGASQTAISDWLNAKKFPRIDKIEKLANYFGVRKSDLIEDHSAMATYRETLVEEMTRKLMLLPPEDRAKAVDYLNYLVEQSKKRQLPISRLPKEDLKEP